MSILGKSTYFANRKPGTAWRADSAAHLAQAKHHRQKPMKQPNSLFTANGTSYAVPFMLIASLFFLWGFAHSILEVLNPHFQQSLHISKTMAAFVQAAVYGGYFLMALPAGHIVSHWGYRKGVLTGLALYGAGALMFIPGSMMESFPFYVFSLFVIGCGLTCLETSANPYTTVLGPEESAERRINLAQSLNGVGWIAGPLAGGALLFSGRSIAIPYAIVGVVVLGTMVVFSRCKLPEMKDAGNEADSGTETGKRMWNAAFVAGMAALFFYVAAQTGVNSFFINYMTDCIDLSPAQASRWLGFGGMGLFVVGRAAGSWIMGYVKPANMLLGCAALASAATLLLVRGEGNTALGAFLAVYLAESIMFPTIFSLALRSSNGHTKKAASLLIMTIVGGAVAPVIMGSIADHTGSMALAFTVPLLCYIYILAYSLMKR